MPENLPKYVVVEKGSWSVVRSFPSTENYDDGRKKYIQIKRRCDPETEARAKELAEEIHAAYHAQLAEVNAPLTIGTAARRFLSGKKKTVARRTHEIYEEMFDRFVFGRNIEHEGLADRRPLEWQDYFDELETEGVPASTIGNVYDALSALFNRAIVWEEISRNPVKGVDLSKPATRPVLFFDQHDARAFVASCRKKPSRFVFEFALETGMRHRSLE